MKGCLKVLFSYLEYCQIWQNILMDDHHLKNIIKLGGGGRRGGEKEKRKLEPILYILKILKTIPPNLVPLKHFFHKNIFYLFTLKTFC
jgi:hypothetical protein